MDTHGLAYKCPSPSRFPARCTPSPKPRSHQLCSRSVPRKARDTAKLFLYAEAREGVPISQLRVDELLTKTVALIRFSDSLNPFDDRSFNRAALIWDSLSEVPDQCLPRLLDILDSGDIIKLWEIAGERYAAAKQGRLALANYPIPSDFPEETGEVTWYDGKAALGVPWLPDRFKKCFFVPSPSNALCGHLVLNKGILGEILYPVYFQAYCHLTTISATAEVADVSLEYLPADKLKLTGEQLPVSGWFPPRNPRFPFGGGLVDYLRLVAPGVYVGVGWKAPKKKKRDLGKRFLYFVLVKRNISL